MNRSSALLSWLLACVSAFGCGDAEWSSGSTAVGSIGLALSLPDAVTLDSIMFSIIGPAAYEKTGSIPVGPDGTTFTARIDGIPAAAGYSLELNATASDRGTCSGSAKFEVMASVTTAVLVMMRCPGHGSPAEEGTVSIDGSVNICATVEFVTAAPATPGETVALHGEALDDDNGPEAPSFKWSLAAGTELGVGADLEVECSKLKDVSQIVLDVSDGDCGDTFPLELPPDACAEPTKAAIQVGTAIKS